MSTTNLIIEERSRDIGNFMVGRLLPFARKRMVGPFVFIDHMGPTTIGPGGYLDVDQHPHIGLSTLTYLFEGEILHRDSLGSEQLIKPGDVNWMTAGKGVVHTERTPPDKREGKEHLNHGYQIWVALPRELEDMAPEFHHIPAKQLPAWEENSLRFTLIVGKAYGRASPVPVLSQLFMIKIESVEKAVLDTGSQLFGERGFIVVEGFIEILESKINKGQMLVSKAEDNCQITLGEKTTLVLFGGRPFPEKRYIFWNFVSSDQSKIMRASQNWKERKFAMVEGDSSYVPLKSNYSPKFK